MVDNPQPLGNLFLNTGVLGEANKHGPGIYIEQSDSRPHFMSGRARAECAPLAIFKSKRPRGAVSLIRHQFILNFEDSSLVVERAQTRILFNGYLAGGRGNVLRQRQALRQVQPWIGPGSYIRILLVSLVVMNMHSRQNARFANAAHNIL